MTKVTEKISSRNFIPQTKRLSELKQAAFHCRGCDLYARATQTVFGEGAATARMVLIGEQPGDQEDRQGRPFVGPAGKLLDQALEEAGIEREKVYVTNAVKHFKWIPRGKRRLHQKPTSAEVAACYGWLEMELLLIQPEIVVALGATAAQAIMRRKVVLKEVRGRFLTSPCAHLWMATVHPSAILRRPSPVERQGEFEAFVNDLRRARTGLSKAA